MLIVTEKRSGIQATLLKYLTRSCASSQYTQERYKRYLDERRCKGWKTICTSANVFFDVLDSVLKSPTLTHAVEEYYHKLS